MSSPAPVRPLTPAEEQQVRAIVRDELERMRRRESEARENAHEDAMDAAFDWHGQG